MTSPCAATAGSVWTCTLARATPPSYEALVVWDTAGSSSFVPDPKFTKVRDLTGASHSIDPPGAAITIAIKPLILENE